MISEEDPGRGRKRTKSRGEIKVPVQTSPLQWSGRDSRETTLSVCGKDSVR